MLLFTLLALGILVSSTFSDLSSALVRTLSLGSAVLSIFFAIRAFTQKENADRCWNTILLAQLFMFIFLFLPYNGLKEGLILYASGILISFVLGHICLYYLKQRKESISLRECQGHMYEYPILGNIFFLVCLGFMLFPITPSFLGEELLLSNIHTNQWLEIALFGIGFFLTGVNITRLFAKVFFGPHKKTYHEIAYKSA
jgi:NADH:ubiquinone oxidoreductase subunit 4 (subunit M)